MPREQLEVGRRREGAVDWIWKCARSRGLRQIVEKFHKTEFNLAEGNLAKTFSCASRSHLAEAGRGPWALLLVCCRWRRLIERMPRCFLAKQCNGKGYRPPGDRKWNSNEGIITSSSLSSLSSSSSSHHQHYRHHHYHRHSRKFIRQRIQTCVLHPLIMKSSPCHASGAFIMKSKIKQLWPLSSSMGTKRYLLLEWWVSFSLQHN